MKFYFYQGKFSGQLITHVLQNPSDFQKTMRLSIEAFGGSLDRCLLTASGSDPIGFVSFPDDTAASAWNTFYKSQDGVVNSKIQRLLDEEDLVEVAKLVADNVNTASVHRKK